MNEALGHAASDKRLEVLRRVAQSGSISQAARETGISYKAAWQAIDTLTSLSGVDLVARTVGGVGGGGAQITSEGLRLLALADELTAARQRVLAQFAGGAALAGGLGLRTSMRNQLPCTVMTLNAPVADAPLVQVILQSAGGDALEASVTRESADLLGLRVGLVVLAMCKATAVRIEALAAPQADLDSGLGALTGRAQRVSEGLQRDEVSLALRGGGHWVGLAARPWRAREGDVARAVMATSALVIGLPNGV